MALALSEKTTVPDPPLQLQRADSRSVVPLLLSTAPQSHLDLPGCARILMLTTDLLFMPMSFWKKLYVAAALLPSSAGCLLMTMSSKVRMAKTRTDTGLTCQMPERPLWEP